MIISDIGRATLLHYYFIEYFSYVKVEKEQKQLSLITLIFAADLIIFLTAVDFFSFEAFAVAADFARFSSCSLSARLTVCDESGCLIREFAFSASDTVTG